MHHVSFLSGHGEKKTDRIYQFTFGSMVMLKLYHLKTSKTGVVKDRMWRLKKQLTKPTLRTNLRLYVQLFGVTLQLSQNAFNLS